MNKKKSTLAAIITIFLVLLFDQWLKIWVKLNFHYGDYKTIIPGWFDLQFVENPGMAFGWMIPGDGGKLLLSIFRIVVVSGIGYYLYKLIKQGVHLGYIISVSLIIAGAAGNIFDSVIYGVVFDRGSTYDPEINDYTMYFGKASFTSEQGYAAPLKGNVVDMFHFTKRIEWGGKSHEIFPPVFNVADSSITIGIILILLFQRRFFRKENQEESDEDTPELASDKTSENPEEFLQAPM